MDKLITCHQHRINSLNMHFIRTSRSNTRSFIHLISMLLIFLLLLDQVYLII